jgi:hypothetical protein
MIPWITGSILGFVCGHCFSADKKQTVLLALTGGVLGIFALTPLTLYFDSAAVLLLQLSAFLGSAVIILPFFLIFAGCIWLLCARSPSLALSSLYLGGLVMFLAYTISLLPISSWDFLSFWGVRANDLIEHLDSGSSDSFVYNHPHPITLIAVAAWGGMANAQEASHAALASIWAMLACSTLGGIFVYARLRGCSTFLASLCALFLLTMPLYENHLLLIGYAELPLISLTTLSTIWLAIGRETPNQQYVALAIVLAVIAIYTKNTGFFYGVSIISAHFLCLLCEKISERVDIPLRTAFIWLILVLVCLSCTSVVTVLTLKISLSDINLAGYASFTKPPTFLVFKNVLTALVLKTSFSVSILLFLAYLLAVSFTPRISATSLFLALLCLIYFFGAVAIQLTDHGSEFGAWNSDTSYSRALLPMIALAPLLLAQMMADIKSDIKQDRAHTLG